MLSRPEVYELMLPFATGEHGFTPVGGGNVPYIRKSAIERRFHRVTPGWSLAGVHHIATENDTVVIGGTLILAEQNFAGVGTGIVQRYKKVNGQSAEVDAYELARNTARAYKQAASDLLPRCAAIAGVGWYLREAPPQWKSKIGNEQGLREYLQFVHEQMRGWNPDNGTPNLGSGAASGAARRIGGEEPARQPEPAKPEPFSDLEDPITKLPAGSKRVFVREIYMQRQQKNTAKYTYVLRCADNVNRMVYTGDAFRAAGLNPDEWKQDNRIIRFDPALEVYARQEQGGQWVLEMVIAPEGVQS